MRHLLLALMCAMCGGSALADGYCMLVSTSDSDAKFWLNEVQDVKFTDSEMTVTLSDATSLAFQNSDNWKATFSYNSGVEGIDADHNGNVPADVYDLNGVKVSSLYRLSDLDLKDLRHGVYVVKTANKSIKIIK